MSHPSQTVTTGRFAPSPTGRMHLGNVYAALMSWLWARREGGRWLLRIEDLDPQRSRREYALQLMDDLHWLGLDWDGDPLWQSARGDRYAAALARLETAGFTYPCYCTRADIMATQAPHVSDGRVVYSGRCRPPRLGGAAAVSAPPGRKGATRLWVPDRDIVFTDGICGRQQVNLARDCGDFVVRRADGAWAYQLAVVVDDGESGVSQIVRGNDLLLSAAGQLYLYDLLGLPCPQFVHIPLMVNEQRQRLSKRDSSLSLEALRGRKTAREVIGAIAAAAGIVPAGTAVTPQELLQAAPSLAVLSGRQTIPAPLL